MRQAMLLAVLCVGLARTAEAQPPSGQAQGIEPLAPQRRYNGIVAGEEAYLANDARRAAEIGRQANLNADMYWRWSGASSWYPGVFEAWPTVPGEIVGWPAAVSPPVINPTNVQPSPIRPWSAAAAPAVGAFRPMTPPEPGKVVVAPRGRLMQNVPVQNVPVKNLTADGTASPGLLPGFVPQAESPSDSAKQGAGSNRAPGRGRQPELSGGPRAF